MARRNDDHVQLTGYPQGEILKSLKIDRLKPKSASILPVWSHLAAGSMIMIACYAGLMVVFSTISF